MKFCTNCGKELADSVAFCSECGTACANPTVQQPTVQQPAPATEDAPSLLMGLIGFFIPIAGLIIYLINKDTRPLEAASAGKGALISVICSFAFSILYVILIFFLTFFSMGMGMSMF